MRCSLRANLRSLVYCDGRHCRAAVGHNRKAPRISYGALVQPVPLSVAGRITIHCRPYHSFANAGHGECVVLSMAQYRQPCRCGAAPDSFSLHAQAISRLHRFNIQYAPRARARVATLGRWADESTVGLFCRAHPDVFLDGLCVNAHTYGCVVYFPSDGSAMQVCPDPQSACVLLLKDNHVELLQPTHSAVSPSHGATCPPGLRPYGCLTTRVWLHPGATAVLFGWWGICGHLQTGICQMRAWVVGCVFYRPNTLPSSSACSRMLSCVVRSFREARHVGIHDVLLQYDECTCGDLCLAQAVCALVFPL